MTPQLKHLDQVDGPMPEEVARIKRRLKQPTVRRVFITAILQPTGIAIAAAAAILLGALPGAAPLPPPPVAVEAALTEGDLSLTDDIQLTMSGQGTVTGTDDDVLISWDTGRIDVSVTPAQGIDLSVKTSEALISVVGTAFSVDRSFLGSQISVTHGVVTVECQDMTLHRLTAGASATCRAPATLGTVIRMRDLNTPADEVLAEIHRALANTTKKPQRGELLSHRYEVLLESGRQADALTAARAYLSEGHTLRAAELTLRLRDAAP